MENLKLVEYASRFLSSKPRDLHTTVAEQAANFAAQLRDGCRQDLLHLIMKVRADTPDDLSGKDALHYLAQTMADCDIATWGMPDCDCKKSGCVYCSTGMATAPSQR